MFKTDGWVFQYRYNDAVKMFTNQEGTLQIDALKDWVYYNVRCEIYRWNGINHVYRKMC